MSNEHIEIGNNVIVFIANFLSVTSHSGTIFDDTIKCELPMHLQIIFLELH